MQNNSTKQPKGRTPLYFSSASSQRKLLHFQKVVLQIGFLPFPQPHFLEKRKRTSNTISTWGSRRWNQMSKTPRSLTAKQLGVCSSPKHTLTASTHPRPHPPAACPVIAPGSRDIPLLSYLQGFFSDSYAQKSWGLPLLAISWTTVKGAWTLRP